MRIGLVVERFDPSRGGREHWTFGLASRLAARGHDVVVASRDFSEAARRLPVTLLPIPCAERPEAFGEAVQAALTPLRLDVVHDMGPGWFCDVLQPHCGSLAALAERKLLQLPAWLRGLRRYVNRWLPRHRRFHRLMALQYADRGQIVLALSRAAVDDFRHFHAIGPERIRVVHNGVDVEQFSPERCKPLRGPARQRLGVGPHELLALIVAHNFTLKGVPTLLKAMARLKAEQVPMRLAVVGGKHIDKWQRRADRLGLADTVRFIGRVEYPLPYYAAADLYVHPTFYDSCSLVVLEAAACGLPIITSRYNGAAELLRKGTDALVLDDPADAAALADAMRTLVDPAVRARLAAAAHEAVQAHSFERNVDKILDVYREVVRRRGNHRPPSHEVWTARISAGGEGVDPSTPSAEKRSSAPALVAEVLGSGANSGVP